VGNIKNKFIEFDFLRSVAIISIIFCHLHYFIPNSRIWGNFSELFSIIGLGIFSFISGYLISYNNTNFFSVQDIRKFYTKRIVRIYPLYWIALVSYILYLFVYINFLNILNLSADLNTMVMPFLILINFLGLQILTNPAFGIFWYIGFIVLCYFLYPLIRKTAKNDVQFLLFSFLIMGIFGLMRIFFNLIDDRFFIFFLMFVGGVIVYNEKLLDNPFSKDKELMWIGLFCSIVFVFLINKLYLRNIISFDLSIIISYILSNLTVIVFCILTVQLLKKKILSQIITKFSFIIIYVSTAAYCVYLFHPVLLQLGSTISITLGLSPQVNELFILFLVVPLIFVICNNIQNFEIQIRNRIIKVN